MSVGATMLGVVASAGKLSFKVGATRQIIKI